MGRDYAGILGPLAFVTVVARGFLHHAGVESTLFSATLFLFVFGAIGYVLGQWADWIVLDSVRASVAAELRTASDENAPRNTG